MNDHFCPFEAQTAEAARTGHWPDELRDHVAGCAACEQTRVVAAFMNRIATAVESRETAPDPTLIWLKAEPSRRNEHERNERRTWIWSGALSGVAATLTAWASVEWVFPVVRLDPEAFAMGGAAIALTLGVLYFAVYRPLRNVDR